ncbi:DnaJ C-terminal domain-containing protein [Ramlibacter henchirensis]|uniref:DnaJ C-terminal domain-containing protein n=1 Tax=Ramlibacter henchirensis TaxID=204072 RepID=UPI001F0EB1A6|nr:DnaJ C-terminal domain-containing protein [Ramlibacter henchirensis]
MDDCYRELGVAPGSSDAEVKAAWRRLAARWHPDRNDSPDALRKIQRINRALEEIRRSKQAATEEEDEQPAPQHEAPVEHTVDLSLEEVAGGCVRELRGEVVDECADCAGTGLQPHPTACPECDGTGRVRQALWFAWMSPTTECGACRGLGSTRQGCRACDASGKAPARKYRCRVELPPGLRGGSVLNVSARVQGRGQQGRPLPLRVHVQLKAHEFFHVQPDGTLTCELPVDGFAWIAGRWIDVPTPRGLQQMRLRRGTLNYRIKGAGLPWQDAAECGDCIVTVVPLFPQEFSPQQEAAIDRLVAGNTGAAGTEAGDRMAAWKRRLTSWRARIGGATAQP